MTERDFRDFEETAEAVELLANKIQAQYVTILKTKYGNDLKFSGNKLYTASMCAFVYNSGDTRLKYEGIDRDGDYYSMQLPLIFLWSDFMEEDMTAYIDAEYAKYRTAAAAETAHDKQAQLAREKAEYERLRAKFEVK